jgi:hypothetical protein
MKFYKLKKTSNFDYEVFEISNRPCHSMEIIKPHSTPWAALTTCIRIKDCRRMCTSDLKFEIVFPR